MRLAAALLAALLLAGCAQTSAQSGPVEVPVTTTADPSVLPEGTTDLPLKAQTYYSPVGFTPALAVTPTAGWSSSRRGDDAFDLTRPGIKVVIDTPPGNVVATALAALPPAGTPITGMLVDVPARGFRWTGGTGTVFISPSKTITVDLEPGQTTRVLGADVQQVPLLVAVVIPHSTPALLAEADQLVASITGG